MLFYFFKTWIIGTTYKYIKYLNVNAYSLEMYIADTFNLNLNQFQSFQTKRFFFPLHLPLHKVVTSHDLYWINCAMHCFPELHLLSFLCDLLNTGIVCDEDRVGLSLLLMSLLQDPKMSASFVHSASLLCTDSNV